MSKKMRWIVVGVVVVGLAAAFAIAGRKKNGQGVEVETEAAARQEVVQTVTATGRIQPVTQVDISADVSAKITRLEIKEGDWVEKGALLVELDRERYLAEVESA